jgi:hypothetical protein
VLCCSRYECYMAVFILCKCNLFIYHYINNCYILRVYRYFYCDFLLHNIIMGYIKTDKNLKDVWAVWHILTFPSTAIHVDTMQLTREECGLQLKSYNGI